ncbi:putative ubiquitin hydrolase [Leishmania major strain Friedlin]|uniref:Putative ubiquitin carboxy-terminal hydrolase n=1 Tax=Leishmania major TaxID=5664 RepID=Q9U1E5_LEIMA|nr:putative ubiquitin hydrolase [Leishmania major strain Friedlin]CAB55365.1 putative ubiquitin carboxy-terminal hydrolase [Leishmania major]CAG9580430.1 ubiquitin_hydrolase_-_putative [Leishmania major strain Friedlin]CAJ08819.1 putative ubiquitin hydrolase [Leishmania major strain Friedlin]|eukprot:XP_001685615.1 putative ubiquitin hydrolase [Leishmania major strain Friedlin]
MSSEGVLSSGDAMEEMELKERNHSIEGSSFTATTRDSFASAEEDSTASQVNEEACMATGKPRTVAWNGTSTAAHDYIAASTAATDGEENAAVGAQPQPPLDRLQAYIQALVGNILESLRGFDGSIAWLKRSHSAIAAHLDGINAGAVPAATEEFSVAWFGIASAVLHDLIQESVADISALATPPLPFSENEESARGLCVTPRDLSVAFVSGLQSIVSEVMNNGGCHRSGGSHHFSRYSLRSFAHVKEISEMSRRLMEEHLTQGAHVPHALRNKYSDDTTSIDCKEDLCSILQRTADAWVCSFFPAYQQRSRNPTEVAPFLWGEEEDASRLNLELFFYCLYFACQQRSLMQNREALPRGVVVPTAWIEQLLRWSAQAKEQHCLASPGPHPPFPGPIDTFALMTVSPHDPRRHWLSLDSERYQVIPQALYNSFFDFFGTGPKYVMYGAFSLRERCLLMWKPLPLTVFTTFEWWERNESDGALDKYSVEVPVEEALLHSDMREVCHLAWGMMREEEGMMSEKVARVWFAAINGTDTVRICCKGLYMLSVKTGPFAITEKGDGMDLTVQEILQQLRRRIEQYMPESVEEWRLQTSGKVLLSLVLTLNNTNGDDRGGEITGTMEVAAHQCGVCGLTNVGNTCYMNSALQCLSNLTSFRTKLLTLPISHFSQAVITLLLIRLLTTMWSGQHSFAETRELKEQIGMQVKRFSGYQQQDANEFIEVLLDHLSEECNLISERCYRQREDSDKAIATQELSTIFWSNFLENNKSFIPPLFFHQSKTVFTCLTCGECSTVFDNNVTLSVSIKDPPQRRAMSVDVMVELNKPDYAAELASHSGFMAPLFRPVKGGAARAHALVTLKVHLLVQPDNTVREQEVEEALRQLLLSNASSSSEVLRFFLDGSADEMTAEEERQRARSVAARVQVDVRVMDIPDHGRVLAWARCYLASAELSVASAPPPTTVGAAGTPAARVWYFMKDAPLPFTTAIMGTPVWVDEFPASYGAEHPQPVAADAADAEELVLASESRDCMTAYAEHIRTRSLEVATALLQRVPEDETDEVALFNSTETLSGGVGYVMPPSHKDEAKETLASANDAGAAAASIERDIKIVQRILRKSASATVTKTTSPGGDINADATGSEACEKALASAAVTTTIVVCIQYDSAKYQLVTDGRRSDAFGLRGVGSDMTPEVKCSLHECLSHSMQPDLLRGEDAWFCRRCKEFRETKVHRTLFRLPPCLIVSFKRFKMHTYSADKKNTTVQFPSELDFAPYLDPEAAGLQTEGTKYRLRGVVYHTGSLSFGHYTAAAFNDSVKKWVYYNDTHATIDSCDAPAPNGAYILCFERVEATASPA